jgi:hypothetical protein
MAPIDIAIAAIKHLAPGEHFSYCKVAKEFNIQHSTEVHVSRFLRPVCRRGPKLPKAQPTTRASIVAYIKDLKE